MTPLEKLDTVLSFLASDNISIKPYASDGIIIKELTESKNVFWQLPSEVTDILKYLVRDNKIDVWVNDNKDVYRINFNGRVFIEQGGYIEQEKRLNKEKEKIESIRLSQVEMRTFQKESANRIEFLTWILAISSGIVALYYLTKGFLWFCCH